jgi:hypothetical protein
MSTVERPVDRPGDRPSGRHPVNIGHLVMGLALLGILGIWALVQSDVVEGDDVRWLLPIPWVVAGVAGLAATAVTGSRRYAVRQSGWVGEQPDPPDRPGWVGVRTDRAEQPEQPEPVAVTETEETAPLTAQPDPEEKP